MTHTGIIASPVGPLLVTTTDRGLSRVSFLDAPSPGPADTVESDVISQLRAYFSGTLRAFSVPVHLENVSDFTRKVLEATAAIPYGETVSYGEIARRIGMPGATQAVGNALGSNPVPIVIPCHRVIRSDGSMGWFTGGQHIKRALLKLEGVHYPEQQALPL